jgi:GT2 family glycosyltransferase
VRIIPMGRNTAHPTMVRNHALRAAAHRYVLLSDNDVTFAPDAVHQLQVAMQDLPHAAVCTPLVVSDDHRTMVYGQAHPMHYLCCATAPTATTVAEAQAVGPHQAVGCGIQLIDKERAEPLGFFDEDLVFGWGDDGDLHHRLTLAGLACYTVPDALVYHRRIRTKARVYGQIHNRWFVLLRDYQLRTLIVTAPALLVFELMLVASVVAMGAAGEYLRAVRDVTGKLGTIRASRRRVQASRRVADREALCADNLDLPRQLAERKLLGKAVQLLNVGFRGYWRLVRPLL